MKPNSRYDVWHSVGEKQCQCPDKWWTPERTTERTTGRTTG